MKGLAYVFLRKNGAPLPPGCAGHVGWGFQMADGSFCFGSTENPKGYPQIFAPQFNGGWLKTVASEKDMVREMANLALFDLEISYDAYKIATVPDCNPSMAEKEGKENIKRGYTAIFNNCLDHVYNVLAAYEVKDLPWKQNHPSPNDWFALFNGEYHNL